LKSLILHVTLLRGGRFHHAGGLFQPAPYADAQEMQMAIKYPALVTDSLAKQISENIRLSILDGRLKPDERLPSEEELAESFGVSRPTIREALKRLAAQNLISSRRGPAGGTFVSRPNPEQVSSMLTTATTLLVSMGAFDLGEIAEAREELELVCCRLAAERREERHLEAMARELERQKDPDLSDHEFCDSDVRFHRAVVDGAGNPLLRFVMFAVIEAIQPATNMVSFRVHERMIVVSHHKQLYEAIRAQDTARAGTALSGLMAYLREKYAAAIALKRRGDIPESRDIILFPVQQ
jgi:GntR family transcriptional regulator, transcriptional repressor for pyruvate dehydrogenase complex